jgi:hypothetical protein
MTTDRTRVLIDPANPFDFVPSDFDELIAELAQDAPEIEVRRAFRPEVGYGGPLTEVLHVWMDIAETIDAVATTAMVVKHFTGFLRRRQEADRQNSEPGQGPPRKRALTLYVNGEVAREVSIDSDGTITDVAVEPGNHGPHPQPKISD